MRPDRLSMEGMIWNADHVLELALHPDTQGIPKDLFRDCVGICIISVVEAGFMFSGSVGTGILIKRHMDGTWSPPCAMGLGGIGWGLLVGAALKDIIIFVMDDPSMDAMCTETGIRMEAQLNVTVADLGRNYEGGVGLTKRGAYGLISVAFSRGAFLSFSIEGSIVRPRGGVNDTFYGKETTVDGILNGNNIKFPKGRPTLIGAVYDKLDKLCRGEIYTPTAEEVLRKQQASKLAQKASDDVKKSVKGNEIMKIDAAEEAKKEGATLSEAPSDEMRMETN